MVIWTPLKNYAAIEHAKENVWEVWFDEVLVFTAKHCYLLKQSKHVIANANPVMNKWICIWEKKKRKVKELLSVVDKIGINGLSGAPEPSFSHIVN